MRWKNFYLNVKELRVNTTSRAVIQEEADFPVLLSHFVIQLLEPVAENCLCHPGLRVTYFTGMVLPLGNRGLPLMPIASVCHCHPGWHTTTRSTAAWTAVFRHGSVRFSRPGSSWAEDSETAVSSALYMCVRSCHARMPGMRSRSQSNCVCFCEFPADYFGSNAVTCCS